MTKESLEKIIKTIDMEPCIKKFIEKFIEESDAEPNINKEFKNLAIKLYDQMGVDLNKNPNKETIKFERERLSYNLRTSYWFCKFSAMKVIIQKNIGYSPETKYYAREVLYHEK